MSTRTDKISSKIGVTLVFNEDDSINKAAVFADHGDLSAENLDAAIEALQDYRRAQQAQVDAEAEVIKAMGAMEDLRNGKRRDVRRKPDRAHYVGEICDNTAAPASLRKRTR